MKKHDYSITIHNSGEKREQIIIRVKTSFHVEEWEMKEAIIRFNNEFGGLRTPKKKTAIYVSGLDWFPWSSCLGHMINIRHTKQANHYTISFSTAY